MSGYRGHTQHILVPRGKMISLHWVHCTMWYVNITLYYPHCMLYTVHWKLQNVHCRWYTLICTVYTISCIVYWSLYTDHCRQYTAYNVAQPVDPAANYSITMGRASPQTYKNVSCLFVLNWLSHPSFSIYIYMYIQSIREFYKEEKQCISYIGKKIVCPSCSIWLCAKFVLLLTTHLQGCRLLNIQNLDLSSMTFCNLYIFLQMTIVPIICDPSVFHF